MFVDKAGSPSLRYKVLHPGPNDLKQILSVIYKF